MYFEKQLAGLCGQHLLNNLVQRPFFSVEYLMDVARELDENEASLGVRPSRASASQNISDSGDFSNQVLEVALERAFKLKLVRDRAAVDRALAAYDADPNTKLVTGVVFNLDEHWFCARRVGETFYLFDSLDERPREIRFLTTYIAQMRAEDYTVFLVEGGDLPAPDPRFDNVSPEKEKDEGKQPTTTTANSVKPFSGKGFSLKRHKNAASSAAAAAAANHDNDDDDPELHIALAQSLIEQEQLITKVAEEDKDLPPVAVGIQVVLPGTGRKLRHKFPPGSLGKAVFELVRDKGAPEVDKLSLFTLRDPVSKTTLPANAALARFAPSATFAVELE